MTASTDIHASATAVSFEKVTHVYSAKKRERVTALNSVSFHAEPGKLTALVGPNGSGKSTSFQLLTGQLAVQQGAVSVNGEAVGLQTEYRKELGVVFQQPSLDEELTALENMQHYAMLFGITSKEAVATHRVIDALGLRDVLGKKVKTLSGGYRRRVELAKTLIPEPKTLILDEPFSGLDIESRETFFSLLKELQRNNGITVILVTHLMSIAARCDRVVILESGTVVVQDDPKRLIETFGDTVIEVHAPVVDSILSALGGVLTEGAKKYSDSFAILTHVDARDVFQKLNGEAAEVDLIEARKPNLEDYFLTATGKMYKTRVAA